MLAAPSKCSKRAASVNRTRKVARSIGTMVRLPAARLMLLLVGFGQAHHAHQQGAALVDATGSAEGPLRGGDDIVQPAPAELDDRPLGRLGATAAVFARPSTRRQDGSRKPGSARRARWTSEPLPVRSGGLVRRSAPTAGRCRRGPCATCAPTGPRR
ncbi:MAG: hypothetical protein U1E17_12685 [Geminicoccaceae bacterium]